MSKWMIVLPPEGAARQVGEYTIEAFAELLPEGAARVFDTKTYLTAFDSLLKNPEDDITVDLLNQSLIVNCLDAKVSHVLVLALSPITVFALQLLRRQGVTTIHWFYEDFRVAHYWKHVLGGYDYFFAVQKNDIENECMKRGVQYEFLPTAVTPHLPDSLEENRKKWDCAFVGVPSAYRITVLEQLHAEGITLAISGLGWDVYSGVLDQFIISTEWVEPSEAMEIYNNSSVGLNLSNQDPSDDRENPQVSPRVYDILSSSAKLVVEDLTLLSETLPGFSYYTFKTVDELVPLIKAQVKQIAPPEIIQLHQKLLREKHQYTQRVQRIIEKTNYQ